MEFATPAVQKVYEHIEPLIKELFGEFSYADPTYPAFRLNYNSAYVTIVVNPWGEDDATIQSYSLCVTGAEITSELMRYLLGENANLRFGAFGVDGDDDIIFHHSIVGLTCDKEELRASVLGVLYTSDKYDDQIVAKFGGIRASDRTPK